MDTLQSIRKDNYEMSDDEFTKCFTINNFNVHMIKEELEQKGITDLREQIIYVKKNFDGQYYMYFALQELNNVILNNHNKMPDTMTFSVGAIDGLLRAVLFPIELMHANIPQHVFNYMDSKSSSFIQQLLEIYEKQGIE